MTRKLTLRVIVCSLLFWLICSLTCIVYNIVGIFMLMAPFKIRHRLLTTWSYIFVYVAKYLCGISFSVRGLEHFDGAPAIFALNHQSMWETFACNILFPPHVWVIKREILWVPIVGWTLALVNPIAINRKHSSSAIKQIESQAQYRVEHDKFSILLFPEGTRIKPKVRVKYKTGIGRVAHDLHLNVIPIAHNAGYCIPRRSMWLYPGKIDVIVDKPIDSSSFPNAHELTNEVQRVIHHNLETINS